MAGKVAAGQLALPIDPDSRYEADVRRITARITLALGVAGVTDRDFRCRWACRDFARVRVRHEGAEYRLTVLAGEVADGGAAELGVLEILAQKLDALAARVQNGERLADVLGPWRLEGKAHDE